MDSGQTQHQPFPETRWTLIGRARDSATEGERARALSDLCKIYWPPVFSFIRSSGYSPHDAEDLTQGFFARFLDRNDFADRDASQGRLRSYLISSVKNYLASEARKRGRIKRGGRLPALATEGNRGGSYFGRDAEPADELTPDRVFERQWAITLLECVVKALAIRYERDGNAELFCQLKDFIVPQAENPSTQKIAAHLGMNESAVRVAIHRLRLRYRECLLEAVGDTLAPGESAEDELKHLMAAFA